MHSPGALVLGSRIVLESMESGCDFFRICDCWHIFIDQWQWLLARSPQSTNLRCPVMVNYLYGQDKTCRHLLRISMRGHHQSKWVVVLYDFISQILILRRSSHNGRSSAERNFQKGFKAVPLLTYYQIRTTKCIGTPRQKNGQFSTRFRANRALLENLRGQVIHLALKDPLLVEAQQIHPLNDMLVS